MACKTLTAQKIGAYKTYAARTLLIPRFCPRTSQVPQKYPGHPLVIFLAYQATETARQPPNLSLSRIPLALFGNPEQAGPSVKGWSQPREKSATSQKPVSPPRMSTFGLTLNLSDINSHSPVMYWSNTRPGSFFLSSSMEPADFIRAKFHVGVGR